MHGASRSWGNSSIMLKFPECMRSSNTNVQYQKTEQKKLAKKSLQSLTF